MRLRNYQARALKNVIIKEKARSGLIVLPCGAGKTLVGIMAIEQMKCSAIIICDSNVSLEQWRRELEKYTTINSKRIVRATGFVKDKWTGEQPIVLLTTYSWLIAQMVPSRATIVKQYDPWVLIQSSECMSV